MNRLLSFLILSCMSVATLAADVFMTELTDPQNSSDSGRYVELYNSGDAVVDLSTGWQLQRWTNAAADPQSPKDLTGTILPGGFYIICTDDAKFAATFPGITCDQDIGTGGPADSNGDDHMALLSGGEIVDIYGVPGTNVNNGVGNQNFEDGRAERAASNSSASITFDVSGWNIDNDQGDGSGNQYAPDGFDPGAWIGATGGSDDVFGCMDIFGLNYNAEATVDDLSCEYADHVVETSGMSYVPADLTINIGESVQWNNTAGSHDVDASSSNWTFETDVCGGPCMMGSYTFDTAGTFNYLCSFGNHADMGMVGSITVVDPTVSVTFSVDMGVEGVADSDNDGVLNNIKVRVDGGDWVNMSNDGNDVFSATLLLAGGNDYTYNFNNEVGYGYESSSGLADCAGGTYGNDRYLTLGDSDLVLDTVCWGSCEACPDFIYGCTNPDAFNYDPSANTDDESCITDAPEGLVMYMNEIHYDNAGSDVDEGVEVVLNAGLTAEEIALISVTFYNGGDNAADDTHALTDFEVGETVDGLTYYYKYMALQNGSPDGLALVGYGSVEFLSWEGSFTALDGPAGGVTSTEISSQPSSTPIGTSMGNYGEDGWISGLAASFGAPNTALPSTVMVTFNVDMNGADTPDGISIAGGLFGSPGDNPMALGDDGLWTFTSEVAENSTITYKFVTGSCGYNDDGTPITGWSCSEDLSGQDCAVGNYNDRELYVGSDDIAVNGCFGICGDSCPEPAVLGCMDPNATNYDVDATEQSYNEFGTSTCTYASCDDIPTETGCLWDDGTSAAWWDGWWNCTENAGTVCGLAEVVFELNLPDGLVGTPHVNGTYNGWCGSCYNDMTLGENGTWSHVQYFDPGVYHDYKFSLDGWNDQEDLTGLECAAEADGYWNRNFTAGDANTSQTLTYCWGSCEATCDTIEPPVEYTVTFDVDGVEDCDFVSVTGTWDNWSGWGAHTDNAFTASMAAGDYEYVILCTSTDGFEWWTSIWDNSTIINADGLDCAVPETVNYGFSVEADMTVSICAGSCDAECGPSCSAGDVNSDGNLNVMDIIIIVENVLAETTDQILSCGDFDGNGAVNILDIVQMVEVILAGSSSRIAADATTSSLDVSSGTVTLDADGYIGAVQLKLNHSSNFSIDLTHKSLISDYKTTGNSTTIIVVAPESNELFSASGDFTVESITVANSDSYVDVEMPSNISLTKAYPNPFNPSTTFSVYLPSEGFVNLSVYNVMGQLVDVLQQGNMSDGYHSITWNASDMTSGVYFVRAEALNGVAVQKVMLMK